MLGFYKGQTTEWDDTLNALSKALSDEAVQLFITSGLHVKNKVEVSDKDLKLTRLRDFTDLLWNNSKQVIEASLSGGEVNVAVTAEDGTKIYYVA